MLTKTKYGYPRRDDSLCLSISVSLLYLLFIVPALVTQKLVNFFALKSVPHFTINVAFVSSTLQSFEEREMEWEHREVELDRVITGLERQQAEIAGAASQVQICSAKYCFSFIKDGHKIGLINTIFCSLSISLRRQ